MSFVGAAVVFRSTLSLQSDPSGGTLPRSSASTSRLLLDFGYVPKPSLSQRLFLFSASIPL